MKRIFLSLSVIVLFIPLGFANSSEFPFTYNAKTKTGSGTVYASTSDVFNPARNTQITNSGKITLPLIQNVKTAYQEFFLDALPSSGYGLKQWRKVDSNGNTIKTISNTRKCKIKETLGNDESVFYYEADFEETMVSVDSETPARCQAYIDKEINSIGDIVVLTATTNDNCAIKWIKNGVEVSSDNPLVVNVTEKAHYTASASLLPASLEDGYYRFRSAVPNNQYENDYMKIADSWFEMSGIVGSARNVIIDVPGVVGRAQNQLKRDLNVNISNYISDPGTVVYIKHGSSNLYNIFGQGIHVKELTTGTHHGSSSGDIPYDGCYVTILNNGGVYSLYANIKVSYSGQTIDFGNFYFGDINHSFSMSHTDCNANNKWYLEKVDGENGIFAPDFSSAVSSRGKYYTTLRLPFNAKIPSGSNLKAYSITGYPTSTDGNATTTVYQAASTIPAGLPVVVESASNLPQDCILIPDGDPSSYISSSVANSTSGITTGITTALYNKYGKHSHDTHRDQIGTGDSIGYFTQTYKNSTPIYKLGVKDGRVGFWDAVANNETVYGNTAYATQECALFPIDEMELKTVVKDGFENTAYKVSNNLYGVAVAGGKLYAKDNNQYATPSVKPADAIDYMAHANLQTGYDQSNWVALNVENPGSYVDKDLQVVGSLLRKPNPEMTVTKITATAPASSGYTSNVYIPANFMGETQTSTVGNQNTYFFVTPKPQEYAHISWAVYGGDGKFYVNAPEGSSNLAHIKGGFIANDAMMPAGTSLSHFIEGNSYEFNAIIQRASASNLSLRATPYTDGGFSTDWVVYPLEAPAGTPTAVTDIATTKSVTGIKYYNLAGMASDVPFDGINIRVTTYSDGTRQASKIRF